MKLELHQATILANAIVLGFNQEACLCEQMNLQILEFCNTHIKDDKEKYIYLFEKMMDYAESWICDHQVEPFVKEMYVNLHCKRAFGYQCSNGGWVEVDSHGEDLIDWDAYPDCKDDDKIFFYSAVDIDCKTVLKFYDLGSKRHQR